MNRIIVTITSSLPTNINTINNSNNGNTSPSLPTILPIIDTNNTGSTSVKPIINQNDNTQANNNVIIVKTSEDLNCRLKSNDGGCI